VEVEPRERVARWRPLVNWLLALPLLLWLILLMCGAVAAVVVAWFAILFTGRMPGQLGDYLMGVLRYGWRVCAFLLGLTECYPGFRVVAGYLDPGRYPAVFYCAQPLNRNRMTVLLRPVLIVPLVLFACLVVLVMVGLLVSDWFRALIVGSWPVELRSVVVEGFRWLLRVASYGWLIVDDYPALAGDQTAADGGGTFVTVHPDPREVTGPPWPRLVGGEAYRPPPLLSWSSVGAIFVVVGGISVGLCTFDHLAKPAHSIHAASPSPSQAPAGSSAITGWKKVPAASLSGTHDNYVFPQVSCTSATDCMAVGASYDGLFTNPISLIEHWNGQRWVLTSGSIRAGTMLFGAECLSAKDCWADGFRVSGPGATGQSGPHVAVFEHWNG
jgi:hypothetical protein